MQSSSVRGSLIARSPAVAAVAVSAALLAACSSMGGGSSAGDATVIATDGGGAAAPAQGSGNMLANALFGGPSAGKAGAVVLDPNDFQKTVTLCPPVSIRPGTEQMTALSAGAKPDPITGAPPPVTYQSSIVKTARECRAVDGGVAVKVGVIGRTVAGPAGKAGTITVPLRIAVVQGTDKIVKSELFKIPVNLTEPTLSTDFTKIYDQIVLPIAPGNSDYRIYVGFDDAPGGAARR